ncbi:hypothetical protein ACJBZX_11490, partial [Streptococcus suis]
TICPNIHFLTTPDFSKKIKFPEKIPEYGEEPEDSEQGEGVENQVSFDVKEATISQNSHSKNVVGYQKNQAMTKP